MREEAVAKKVFSCVEQIWDPTLVYQSIFDPCFEGFCNSQDPSFVQSCCFLALSMLETDTLVHYDVFKSLMTHLHSLAEPSIFSLVMERLSQTIARQEDIRLLYYPPSLVPLPNSPDGSHRAHSVDSSDSDSSGVIPMPVYQEPSIAEWANDLGSPWWVAFNHSVIWMRWLEGMKGILAEYSQALNLDSL